MDIGVLLYAVLYVPGKKHGQEVVEGYSPRNDVSADGKREQRGRVCGASIVHDILVRFAIHHDNSIAAHVVCNVCRYAVLIAFIFLSRYLPYLSKVLFIPRLGRTVQSAQ